eukprot:GFUD01130332.1.p1 GENE.GFUD01130332.1~~GFUD01130332.1.p1  ORF type:complete len:141 (-),score=20.04 GFUD01130332.1:109-480(-)
MVFVQTSVGLIIGNCKYKCKANGGCRSKQWDTWLGQWEKSGKCNAAGQCHRNHYYDECMHCKDALTCTVPVPTSCYSNWVTGSGICPAYEYNNGQFVPVPVDFVSDVQEDEYCQSFPYDHFVC